MGIKGLLPYLKSITKEISLSDIKESTVAIDTYGWLYKATMCCSDKIALGEDTDIYLSYCVRYIKLLHLYDIKVILVFDGKNLPAKLGVENKRQQNRESFRSKGMQFTLERKTSEAKECFDKCLEISHKLAVKLIKMGHSLGVKCIVAPYEADAQLAYLGKNHIVDYIITEDSDLLLFGTPKVLFKLDFNGRANLIEINDINKVLKFPLEKYSYSKFRYMCIISGCDYFPGLAGIGLITAAKIIQKTQLINLGDFLSRINMYSKTKVVISKDEINQAIQADLTFQYQIVFDPVSCRQVPLNNYAVDVNPSDLYFAGEIIEDKQLVFQLAIGQRDPTNQELIPNFELDHKIQSSTPIFYFDKTKKLDKGFFTNQNFKVKTPATKEKKLKVQCQFPWKHASKQDTEIDFHKFFEIYTDDAVNKEENNVIVKNTDNDKVETYFNDLMSNEETVTLLNIANECDNYPFSGNSIIRNKRPHLFSPNKENEINKGKIKLSGKKEFIQSKLSHLFRKSQQN